MPISSDISNLPQPAPAVSAPKSRSALRIMATPHAWSRWFGGVCIAIRRSEAFAGVDRATLLLRADASPLHRCHHPAPNFAGRLLEQRRNLACGGAQIEMCNYGLARTSTHLFAARLVVEQRRQRIG